MHKTKDKHVCKRDMKVLGINAENQGEAAAGRNRWRSVIWKKLGLGEEKFQTLA